MSGSLLPTLVQLTLGVSAFTCLALTMDRHARQTGFHFKQQNHRTLLRLTGWSLLAVALFIAVSITGWGFGVVSLLGVLNVSAVLVIGLITYRPMVLIPTALGNAAIGVALLGFILMA